MVVRQVTWNNNFRRRNIQCRNSWPNDVQYMVLDSDKDAIDIDTNGVTTFSQAIDSIWCEYNCRNNIYLTALDIDGGTDIGEALVDADLFIVDNGAGGTNRKVDIQD